MKLARDLLDAQLVDAHSRMLGRVDGIVLEVAEGRPPRVIAMEVGALTLARRISPRVGRWARALALRLVPVPWRPVRVPLSAIRDMGTDIEIEIDDATRRRLLRLETWLKRHLVARLPGGADA